MSSEDPTAPDFTHTVISRPDAFKEGRKYFFTGRACSSGHIARRYVSTGSCMLCQRQYSEENRKVYKATRATRGREHFLIVTAAPEVLATVRVTAEALGCVVRTPEDGPKTRARVTVAPANWKPPVELVNPTVAQTEPATMPWKTAT